MRFYTRNDGGLITGGDVCTGKRPLKMNAIKMGTKMEIVKCLIGILS